MSADAVSYSDYYAYGSVMPDRNANIADYRFGFNGMEADNNLKGNGNSYTTEFRQYDPRLGRWLSKDPIFKPFEGRYSAMLNNPIFYNDPLGNDPPKKYSLIQKVKNVVNGKGYKNKLNNYAVKHGVDESEIHDNGNFGYIDENFYTHGTIENHDGNFVSIEEELQYHEAYRYFYNSAGKGKNDKSWRNWFDSNGWNITWGETAKYNKNGYYNRATNIGNMASMGLNGYTEIELVGSIQEKIKKEPELVNWEKELIKSVQLDPRYGSQEFSITQSKGIEFGPSRGSLDPREGSFWTQTVGQVATSKLTWSVRHATVTASVISTQSGTIHIYYHLQDTWDLSPQPGRLPLYNQISSAGGFLWHDLAGASKPKVQSNWVNTYEP